MKPVNVTLTGMKNSRTAIAKLLRAAAEEQDRGARDIARAIGWSHQAVTNLLQGFDRKGGRYLGLGGRRRGPVLLAAVAMELRIPAEQLAASLLADLGFKARRRRPASKSAPPRARKG